MTDMLRHRDPSSSCPICGGHEFCQRGTGTRCFGYTTDKTVFCTRMESKTYHDGAAVWSHNRNGQCDCGYRHSGDGLPGPVHAGMPGMTPTPPEDRPPSSAGAPRSDEDAEAVYVYHSVENAPLIRVLRFSDPKEFRQQRWSRELEEWIWGLGPRETRPAAVLYHLAEVRFAVAQRQPIWLCEGEKDVEALNLHFSERTGEDPVEGFATCNAGGSSQFTYHHAEQLRDAVQVNVIRDKDDAGAAWSRKIFGLLEDAAGTGMIDIRIWEVPMEKQGADWSDWAAEGGSVDGLVLVFPTPVERQRFAIRGGASVPKALHRVNLKVFNSVPALSWPSDLPKFPECSGLTILSGQTGSAKSWLAIAMSLQSAMLGIEVAYVSVELDVATVMKRAQAYFSGNLGLVPECWGLYVPMAHEPWENVLNVLEERCTGNPLLLFIDSINTFVVNEEAPGEHDTFQLGTISERIMQCRTMVNRGRGLIGVVLVSEANAAGGMKGRLDFRANISINMEKREDNHRQIDITIVKNWDGYAGQLGLHELDTENGRFTFIPEHEEECAL